MKTIVTFIFVLTFSTQTLQAQYTPEKNQPPPQQNSFYIELLGASFLGASANYERFLSKRPGGFSVRAGIGIGYLPGIFEDDDITYGALPLGLSYNLPVSKNSRHFMEFGGNYIFIFGTKNDNTQLVSPIIGYRYQNASGKFQLRATIFPLLFSSADDDGSSVPWIGVSFGRRF